MNTVAKVSSGDIIETVMVKGDLAKLTADERNAYYVRMCEAVGVNPVTRPFEYITLNGRMVLYARKDCTDQLRKKNGISVTDLTESEREGVYVVTAKVSDHDGRTDIAKGAVNIAGLKGEALANAIMKAETKSKRRATLSICGLGMLDETEVEDIRDDGNTPAEKMYMGAPYSRQAPADDARKAQYAEAEKVAATNAADPPKNPYTLPTIEGEKLSEWTGRYIKALEACTSAVDLAGLKDGNQTYLDMVVNHTSPKAQEYKDRLLKAELAARARLAETSPAPSKPGVTIANPEAFIKESILRLEQCKTIAALDAIWARDVEPYIPSGELNDGEGKLFPSDARAITEHYEVRRRKLGGDK